MKRAGTFFEYTLAFFIAFIVGTQAFDLVLKMWEPFHYLSISAVNPTIRRGDIFHEDVEIQRNRICEVTVTRAIRNEATREVTGRMQEPGGFSDLGRSVARVKYKIPEDALLGKTCMMQRSSSRCVDGVHTAEWPLVCFEIVE